MYKIIGADQKQYGPISGDQIRIDFEGTSAQVPGNVNCPLAVTRSACYFALRVLLQKDIPANAGT